ncbi:hypothetical protein [Nocardioides sediminis]|uniref:hypothetical protein n=1 Tax=Nocardioides sediminis TaxID=433648 RepID=UPI000D3148E5|nr:hypothetical protein [Nocardioides sediminis]
MSEEVGSTAVDRIALLESELLRARRETKWVQGELEHQAEALQRVRRQRARLREQSESLAAALAAELSSSYWRAVETGRGRLRRRDPEADLVREVEASPHFDAGWYLRQHQAAIAGQRLAPALHHVRHANERRLDPGEDFSTARYLRRHPEAGDSGLPALLHATRHGLLDDGLVQVDEADD